MTSDVLKYRKKSEKCTGPKISNLFFRNFLCFILLYRNVAYNDERPGGGEASSRLLFWSQYILL
jgi:hypothetical protein